MVFEPADVEVWASDSRTGEQEVTVTLRNLGGGPVDIAEVRPSCACTVTQVLETTHLEKGASVAIKLRVSPPVYGESDVTVVALATVHQTPPAALSLHLHGSTEVPHLFTSTRSVELVGTAPGEELIGAVDILTDEPAAEAAWITGLESSSPEVTTELIERRADLKMSENVIRCSYVFVVRGATPERATAASTLTLVTSVPQAGKIKLLRQIPVTLQLAPVVRALPAELIARKRDGDARVECRLAIVADDEVSFNISADDASGWFRVTAETKLEDATEHRHTLLVEIDTDKYSTFAAADTIPAIVLATTHPKCKQLRVPVRLLVE